MSQNSLSKTTALLAVVLLALSTVMVLAPEASAADPIADGGPFHVNLKAEDKLSSDTKGDANATGESQYVQGSYDDMIGLGRSNKDWADVGTWTSTARETSFTMGGSISFNMWLNLRDEGFDAEAAFRFTLSVDGTQVCQVEGQPSADPGDNSIYEYRASGTCQEVEVPEGAEISLYIEYNAWEDCDIHFDSATYDSGYMVTSNFCKVYSFQVGTKETTVEVFDAWGADWEAVANHFVLDADGSSVDFQVSSKNGKNQDFNGSKLLTTMVILDYSGTPLSKGQSVDIYVQYTPANKEEAGYKLNASVGSGSGSTGDDDDDEGSSMTIILVGGVLALVAIGVVFMVVTKKGGDLPFLGKKSSDAKADDDDDDDWDDDEEEDEEYEEDDEMDYE